MCILCDVQSARDGVTHLCHTCAPLPGVMLLWSHAIKPSGAWQADEYSQVCHNHYLTMLIVDNHHNHHHHNYQHHRHHIPDNHCAHSPYVCRISHDGYPLLCNKILTSNLSFWGTYSFRHPLLVLGQKCVFTLALSDFWALSFAYLSKGSNIAQPCFMFLINFRND